MDNHAKVGITFSHRHAKHLGLSATSTLTHLCKQNYSYIRLCSYWNEIEKSPGNYDFSTLYKLLEICNNHNQKVIMTLGMKAPRWPEYHWTRMINQSPNDPITQFAVLKLITTTIKELSRYPCISHWQVENEPIDPSGPNNLAIPVDFFLREVVLVRSLDSSRPIIGTLWGNDLIKRGLFSAMESIVDIVGIDLYPKQYAGKKWGKPFYRGPSQSDRELKKIIEKSSKPVWITELQAEPWEADDAGYRSSDPGSFPKGQLENNMQWASKFSAKVILLWGIEYQSYITNKVEN